MLLKSRFKIVIGFAGVKMDRRRRWVWRFAERLRGENAKNRTTVVMSFNFRAALLGGKYATTRRVSEQELLTSRTENPRLALRRGGYGVAPSVRFSAAGRKAWSKLAWANR